MNILFLKSLLFSILVIYLKFFFHFLFFPPFLNEFSLYETSPAPSTGLWSSAPVTNLPVTSPARAASQTAVPSISLSPHSAASGTATGSQPSSPRYRPYTVTHPGGTPTPPTPRSSGLSVLSSSPSLPALAGSPQAVPASSSRQRPGSAGPPVLSASPSAVSRRPSSLRISPRYLLGRRAGRVFAVQGEEINTVWKNCCATLTSVSWFPFGVINLCV